jgi:hypothetical protein
MFFATWSMAFGFPVFVFKTDSVLAKLFLITGGMLFFSQCVERGSESNRSLFLSVWRLVSRADCFCGGKRDRVIWVWAVTFPGHG